MKATPKLCMTNQEAYNKALEIVDSKTTMFCFCGKLATGLHTSNCKKFRKELEKEYLKITKNNIDEI